jgi:hypothetical protein
MWLVTKETKYYNNLSEFFGIYVFFVGRSMKFSPSVFEKHLIILMNIPSRKYLKVNKGYETYSLKVGSVILCQNELLYKEIDLYTMLSFSSHFKLFINISHIKSVHGDQRITSTQTN